ncbi:hypothetical protein EXIGLDRAFT_233567 [Exidia glandulosa HHB12029]|uniref:Uncharacterized protein n=1 Tax=Exidia glandulosa HHB12029 TaxID=1314781 RepID=A0A165MIT2_EXIGL|nr:hypothetical protein EXIGLDRAFT_233567 [Exidia glandulosa HHB12029]
MSALIQCMITYQQVLRIRSADHHRRMGRLPNSSPCVAVRCVLALTADRHGRAHTAGCRTSGPGGTPSALEPRHPVTGLRTHGRHIFGLHAGHFAQSEARFVCASWARYRDSTALSAGGNAMQRCVSTLTHFHLHFYIGIAQFFYMPTPPYHDPFSDIFLFLCSLHLHAYARRSEGGLCNGSLYNSDRRLPMYTSVGLRIEISSFTSQSSSDTGPSSPQDTEPSLSARGLSRTLSCSRRGRVSRLFRIIRAPVAVFALVARCSSHDSVVEARRVVQGFLPYGTRSRSGT